MHSFVFKLENISPIYVEWPNAASIGFGPVCDEKKLITMIPMIPHNLFISFK